MGPCICYWYKIIYKYFNVTPVLTHSTTTSMQLEMSDDCTRATAQDSYEIAPFFYHMIMNDARGFSANRNVNKHNFDSLVSLFYVFKCVPVGIRYLSAISRPYPTGLWDK